MNWKYIPNFCKFRILIEFGSFICVCILVSLSRNDPLEKHIIGNLTDYFIDGTDINTSILIDKTKESLFKEIKIHSSNSHTNFQKTKNFRKLVSESFCYEIKEYFIIFKGKKLSSIFYFNYSKIHNLSIADMVVSIVMFVSLFITVKAEKCQRSVFKKVVFIFAIACGLAMIARFILSFILLYYLEKGDLERYDDFLDCKNVKVKIFKEISDINKLRGCFYAFFIFNVIGLGIEKFEKLAEYSEESEKLHSERCEENAKIEKEFEEKNKKENEQSNITTNINA